MGGEMYRALVTGALGQIGTELVPYLRGRHGNDAVIAGDIRPEAEGARLGEGPYEKVDCTDFDEMNRIIRQNEITHIYHLVGVLSAVGEKDPSRCWNVNVNSMLHVLNIAVAYKLPNNTKPHIKVFWPSSIAAFGPSSPNDEGHVEQIVPLEPTTMYGVTKVTGEGLMNWYAKHFKLDCRSLRVPGLISHKCPPGGGTTDYAVDIFVGAATTQTYECFVSEETKLPMMIMEDAIKGIVQLMEAPSESITVRTSYNFGALAFTVPELEREIQRHVPAFTVTYKPDFRNKIAKNWPRTVNDAAARTDWGWRHETEMEDLVKIMLREMKKKHAGKTD